MSTGALWGFELLNYAIPSLSLSSSPCLSAVASPRVSRYRDLALDNGSGGAATAAAAATVALQFVLLDARLRIARERRREGFSGQITLAVNHGYLANKRFLFFPFFFFFPFSPFFLFFYPRTREKYPAGIRNRAKWTNGVRFL